MPCASAAVLNGTPAVIILQIPSCTSCVRRLGRPMGLCLSCGEGDALAGQAGGGADVGGGVAGVAGAGHLRSQLRDGFLELAFELAAALGGVADAAELCVGGEAHG